MSKARPKTATSHRVLACCQCGSTGGYVSPGKARPSRSSGARFGIDGVLCNACYTLYHDLARGICRTLPTRILVPCDLCEDEDSVGVHDGKRWDLSGRICEDCKDELEEEGQSRAHAASRPGDNPADNPTNPTTDPTPMAFAFQMTHRAKKPASTKPAGCMPQAAGRRKAAATEPPKDVIATVCASKLDDLPPAEAVRAIRHRTRHLFPRRREKPAASG